LGLNAYDSSIDSSIEELRRLSDMWDAKTVATLKPAETAPGDIGNMGAAMDKTVAALGVTASVITIWVYLNAQGRFKALKEYGGIVCVAVALLYQLGICVGRLCIMFGIWSGLGLPAYLHLAGALSTFFALVFLMTKSNFD
jgi:hypothetical protein